MDISKIKKRRNSISNQENERGEVSRNRWLYHRMVQNDARSTNSNIIKDVQLGFGKQYMILWYMILPVVIHKGQTGFVRQRQTQDNIRKTLHIMRQVTQQRLETLILSLDAEKAFDSVRWSFLYRVLSKYGFLTAITDTDTPKTDEIVKGIWFHFWL